MARLMMEILEGRELPSTIAAELAPQKPVHQDVVVHQFTPPIGSNKGSIKEAPAGQDLGQPQENGIIAILIGLRQPASQPTPENVFLLPYIEQNN